MKIQEWIVENGGGFRFHSDAASIETLVRKCWEDAKADQKVVGHLVMNRLKGEQSWHTVNDFRGHVVFFAPRYAAEVYMQEQQKKYSGGRLEFRIANVVLEE